MNISEAINLYLKHYPGKNKEEFESKFSSEDDLAAVNAILVETMQTKIDWDGMSLIEIGEYVRNDMHQRHPELTDEALKHLSNFFTYQVK